MNEKKYDPKRMMTGKPSELDKLIRLIRRLIVLGVFVGLLIFASTYIPVYTPKYDTTLFNYVRYHGEPTTLDELRSYFAKSYKKERKKELDKGRRDRINELLDDED